MKTLTLTGDENTPAMPMTEAQVTHHKQLSGGAKQRPLERPVRPGAKH